MDFVVKHRDTKGKIVENLFSALSRQDLFKQLSESEIKAINVRAGNMSSSAGTFGGVPRLATKGLLALAIVVVIGALLCLFLRSPVPDAQKPNDSFATKKLADIKPPKIVQVQSVEPKVEKPIDNVKEERIAKLKAMTPAERVQFFFDEAATKPINLHVSSNRVFRTGVEQIMSWIFNSRLGDPPPLLPHISIIDEAHLAEILTAKNPALEGDSEKVKEAKEMVELAKKELIGYLKNGGDVDEFLEYYRGQLVQANNEWKASQQSVLQVIREEPEIAEEYIKEVNARLAEKGIKPVSVPTPLKKRLGIED